MADRQLTSVPTGPGIEVELPPERHGSPESAPDLLAALDRGDDEAVRAWIAAHLPEPQSLLLYGLVVGAGVIGLLEWPAVALTCAGQFIVDRRFGGVERATAQLRAVVGTPA